MQRRSVDTDRRKLRRARRRSTARRQGAADARRARGAAGDVRRAPRRAYRPHQRHQLSRRPRHDSVPSASTSSGTATGAATRRRPSCPTSCRISAARRTSTSTRPTTTPPARTSAATSRTKAPTRRAPTLGTSLSDAQILQSRRDALAGNHLPYDANGIYFVLTSTEVNASSGFCTQYCGWHTYGTHRRQRTIRVRRQPRSLPDVVRRPDDRPNGNAGADGMASIIAHEIEEAISDPDLNAWYDSRGDENADKCAWTFGTTYTASQRRQVQRHARQPQLPHPAELGERAGGYCAMSY